MMKVFGIAIVLSISILIHWSFNLMKETSINIFQAILLMHLDVEMSI